MSQRPIRNESICMLVTAANDIDLQLFVESRCVAFCFNVLNIKYGKGKRTFFADFIFLARKRKNNKFNQLGQRFKEAKVY